MGKRPSVLPVPKSKEIPPKFEWGNLNNYFSGKYLFRFRLFHLVMGDLSVLDSMGNKWFFEELLAYSRAKYDINMLPALKRIAASGKYNESLRQKASEIGEMLEGYAIKKGEIQKNLSGWDVSEKAQHARELLADTRYPQTAEILRLLRDKSTELKRLALFLIGKFRMADLIQEVCECLNTKGVELEAYSVLLSFGDASVNELQRYYLIASGKIDTGKTILRLIGEIPQSKGIQFLVERLWSNSRIIKEMVLEILLKSKFSLNSNETERLVKSAYETFNTLTWIIAMRISLYNNNDKDLLPELNKEYSRWKNYLINLLKLIDINGTGDVKAKMKRGKKDTIHSSIYELSGTVIDSTSGQEPGDMIVQEHLRKQYKKLKPFFPIGIPEFNSLLEEIINCDYNQIGIWTKACAIRSIREVKESNTIESLVALLFSPEGILREEAARLISRSDNEIFSTTSERIPEDIRKHLKRIINGESDDKELIFEKTRFLTTCFIEIVEDKLLFLAERTSFISYNNTGIYSQPSNTILWSFSEEKAYHDVFVTHEGITDPGRVAKEIRTSYSYCYILPLEAVVEYNIKYPECSFRIFEYIDKYEE